MPDTVGFSVLGENGRVVIVIRLDVGKRQSENGELRPNIRRPIWVHGMLA